MLEVNDSYAVFLSTLPHSSSRIGIRKRYWCDRMLFLENDTFDKNLIIGFYVLVLINVVRMRFPS